MEVSDELHVPVALLPEKRLPQPYKHEAKCTSETVLKFWRKNGFINVGNKQRLLGCTNFSLINVPLFEPFGTGVSHLNFSMPALCVKCE
jgi:hypothetical protein